MIRKRTRITPTAEGFYFYWPEESAPYDVMHVDGFGLVRGLLMVDPISRRADRGSVRADDMPGLWLGPVRPQDVEGLPDEEAERSAKDRVN